VTMSNTGVDAAADAEAVTSMGDNSAVERDRERLRPAHPSDSAVTTSLPLNEQIRREWRVLVSERGESLKCALKNALCADVDPTAGVIWPYIMRPCDRFVKVFPVGPFADEVGVGD